MQYKVCTKAIDIWFKYLTNLIVFLCLEYIFVMPTTDIFVFLDEQINKHLLKNNVKVV